MKKPLAALTGGSGALGQALLEALIPRYEVKALFRQPDSVSQQWAARGCQIVQGDLQDPNSLIRLVAGAQTVFHCAGKVTGFNRRDFLAANVDGTRNVAAAAAAERCLRFLHVSSIAVYAGADAAVEFREDTPLIEDTPMDPYSLSKLQGERVVTEVLKNTGTAYTIVRPTFVYGPRLQPWTLIPLNLIRKNRALYLGLNEGEGLIDAVYGQDVARGILAAAECPAGAGQVFNLGHETVSFKEFYSHLGEMVGVRPRFAPEKNLRRIGKIVRAGSRFSRELLGGIAIGIDGVLRMSLNTRRYPSTKAAAVFGYAPKFSLPVGMFHTELGLKEQGILPSVSRRIPNADRHYSIAPAAVAQPATEADLAQIIREAARRGLKVKVIGALHSFAPLPDTPGVCISLQRMNKIVSIGDTTITAQAGLKISELNRILAEHKMALPIHGSNTEQTIAGAISAGTHGGSIHHGSLSDYVERVRLVKSSGEAVDIDSNGAIVSLGLLGAISTVTMRCAPQFFLRSTTKVEPLATVLKNFDAIQRENEYVDLSYYPQTNEVAMLLINRAEPPDAEALPARPAAPSKLQQKMISRSFKGFLKMLPSLPRGFREAAAKRFMATCYQARHGRSDRVLNFVELIDCDPFPIDDLEFAVPYSAATAVLQTLADRFGKTGAYRRFFPIHIRCSKKGDQWLNANYGQDVCWFEFWQYPPDPAFYNLLHEIFSPFEYRPHWGKLSAAGLDKTKEQFPCLAEFVQLRRQMDPTGMFLNPYLETVFK